MFFKKIMLCAMIGTYLWCQASENNKPNITFTSNDMQKVITIVKQDPSLNKKFEPIINSQKGLEEIIKCINNNYDANNSLYPVDDKNACSHPILAEYYILRFCPYIEKLNYWKKFYTPAQNKKINDLMDVCEDQESFAWQDHYYRKLDNQTIPLFHYSSAYFAMKKFGTSLLCQTHENEKPSVFTSNDMQNIITIIKEDPSLDRKFGDIIHSEKGLQEIIKCVNNNDDENACSHPTLNYKGNPSLPYKQLLSYLSSFYTVEQNKKVDDVVNSDTDYASADTLQHHYKVRDNQTIPLFHYACLYKSMKEQNHFKNEE